MAKLETVHIVHPWPLSQARIKGFTEFSSFHTFVRLHLNMKTVKRNERMLA